MSKKIILFLSDLKENARERSYECPDGTQVTGAQTNEAPVKYLLHAHPGIDEVLCIVTSKARPAFEVLEEAVRAQMPCVCMTRVPFDEGMDFSSGPLAQIMEAMKKGDEILLETTGGLRDAVMQLLLVSRALSFSGIPTVGAVYANFGASQIVDCSHLIGLFDLVGGMQELVSFGSVKTLRGYYKGTAEPEVKALLDAMERLQEDITLCRTGKLDQRITAFNAAMEGAEGCADPLIRALLPAFRAKFGKKLTVPGLILWCVNSDMFQQALTIYKERIPDYILERSILTIKENATPAMDKKWYETENEYRLRTQLLTLPVLEDPEKLERCFQNTDFRKNYQVSFFQLHTLLQDYQYIRLLRNMVNHAGDGENGEGDRVTRCLFESTRYKRLDQVRAEDIQRSLERGLDHLKTCSRTPQNEKMGGIS